ncbi:hypothetical protein AXF42_Ash019473 [Apostasia shenzhenica]|uniref:DUF7794 domain-containing protein n=1 Tax=Apostasia shenzhenica TaxID=1088818 RepID=A0A2I0AYF8_9ASPA|nr:hypothetical protein AXF42_Ash019473 [Apostasia shenzhenica]
MNLASFIENTMKAAVISDFSEASMRSAELFTGRFRGLEALKVEYGQSDITKLGAQLVMESLIMLFNTLQSSSRGSVVGVLVTNVDASAHTDNMIEVAQYARSSRWLDEINFDNETIVEIKQMVLVRRSLAWITGIILLVSTLIGICLLMNMPLTRDTLLYSNVKLD